jgi:hypothetical protein
MLKLNVNGAVRPFHGVVVLSAAVFQAKRRACRELVEGISHSTGIERQPNCTTIELIRALVQFVSDSIFN